MEVKGTVETDRIQLKPMTQAQRNALPNQREGDVVFVADGAGSKLSTHDGAGFTEPGPTGQDFQQNQSNDHGFF